MKQVAIIGGGITGLSTAWALQRAGIGFSLFESSSRVGGVIQSIQENGFLVETGPHSLMVNTPDLESIFQQLDLGPRIVEANAAAKKRFIVRKQQPVPIPMSPLQAIQSPLLSLGAKMRFLREPFIQKSENPDESLASFVRRRLGQEVLDYTINPFVSGIYAGDPEALSVRLAFPKLYRLEQKYGSLIRGGIKTVIAKKKANPHFKTKLISFQNGMQELIDALHRPIQNSVYTDVQFTRITKEKTWEIQWQHQGKQMTEHAKALLITIPAFRIPGLPITGIMKQTSPLFKNMPYAPISMLSLGFKRDAIEHPLDGFGLLIPEKEKCQILGALFPSTLFPNRAPRDWVNLSIFIGGSRQPQLAPLSTQALEDIALTDLKKLLGVREAPVYVKHTYWPQAIPQYNTGHQQYLDLAEQLERSYSGLFIAGNYRQGIAATQCLQSGIEMAEKIKHSL